MSSGISSTKDQAGHGSPFLSFSTVFNNYFIPESITDLMDTSDSEQERYSIKEGDVFLTRTSETVDELGMSCVAIKGYENATYSGFLKRLRPKKEGIVYPKFLAFYLRSDLFRKTMTNNAIMTLRASLNEQIFSYLELLLPPYEEQVKIGDLLYATLEKELVNNRINQELEAMARLIYDYWFVQFDFPISKALAQQLGNPALEGKPYKTSGGPMVYNHTLKREIPEGWGDGTIGSCIKKIIDHRGKTPKKLGSNWSENRNDIIALSAKSIKSGKLRNLDQANRVSAELYEKWMPEKLNNGDILLTSEAPAGEVFFIYKKIKYCLSQRLFALRVDDNIIKSTVLYFDLLKGYSYQQIQGSLSGSTVFGIRQDVLREIKLLLPEINVQEEFDRVVLSLFAEIRNNEKQNQKLTELRDWLLPMLMNGQVTVG